MPSYPCKHPTCTTFVQRPARFCDEHAHLAPRRERTETDRARDRYYNQHLRDEDAKRFYNSAAWQLARETKLASNPVCERCKMAWAKHVHHIIPLKDCTFEQRTAQTNLKSLCPPCHNIVEAEISRSTHAPGND